MISRRGIEQAGFKHRQAVAVGAAQRAFVELGADEGDAAVALAEQVAREGQAGLELGKADRQAAGAAARSIIDTTGTRRVSSMRRHLRTVAQARQQDAVRVRLQVGAQQLFFLGVRVVRIADQELVLAGARRRPGYRPAPP
jgi:hypothetical protein